LKLLARKLSGESMEVEFVSSLIKSTVNVLSIMGQTSAVPGAPTVKSDSVSRGAITGIIGMAGDEITGNMMISFDEPSILSIVSLMLMEEFTEISKDVVDAVGEITNMICGGTKSLLSEHGIVINMASPLVVVGKSMELTQLSKAPVVLIPFTTAAGEFAIEAYLVKR
jgi:chemotaxis protein CheX